MELIKKISAHPVIFTFLVPLAFIAIVLLIILNALMGLTPWIRWVLAS